MHRFILFTIKTAFVLLLVYNEIVLANPIPENLPWYHEVNKIQDCWDFKITGQGVIAEVCDSKIRY